MSIEISKLKEIERTSLDRRSGEDRRIVYDLDCFQVGGKERRKSSNRRSEEERRADWVRIGKWLSVSVQGLKFSRLSHKTESNNHNIH
jgi:hypothetical protein